MLARIYIFIALLLIIQLPVSAASFHDTTNIKVRHFDSQALQQYKTQTDFKYETLKPEGFNLGAWIEYLLLKLLNKIFSPHQQFSFLKLLFYALMIFAALVIVLNLMGINLRSFFTGISKQVISHQLIEENVRELDLDQLIAEAYGNKQWRLATRYQYLKALRLMTDKGLIHWQAGKTNMDYYYELKVTGFKEVFLDITSAFENAWYGHHDLSLSDYTSTSGKFESFYSQIANHQG